MSHHVLIGVEIFTESHLARITAALRGWATWERIAEEPLGELYQAKLAKADIVVGWPDASWLIEPPVKLLLLPSAGFDAYLGYGLSAKPGFRLCNGRGVYGVGAAEHAVALMFCLSRNLQYHVRDRLSRAFVRRPNYGEITGSTACVIGIGNIGAEIVRRCVGLGMRVIGVDRRATGARSLLAKLYSPDDLCEAVSTADHVFCAVPGGSVTRHLIDNNVLNAMQQGAFLYNISRGSIVDEVALVERLRIGRLAGAGLDVFEREPLPSDSPLWTMDNVIITPHCAGFAARWGDRLCDLVIEHLECYRAGQPLPNEVQLNSSRAADFATQLAEIQS